MSESKTKSCHFREAGTIGIIWDKSFSRKGAAVQQEISFLTELTAELVKRSKPVDFILYFLDASISHGIVCKTLNELLSAILNVKYDSATNFSCIKQASECAFYLLFSDGFSNWGDTICTASLAAPMFTISSSATANFCELRRLAIQSGGQFLNLQTMSRQ